MKHYEKLSKWAKSHDMNYLAAWKMAKAGQIEIETLPTGVIRVISYDEEKKDKPEKIVIYTRVSSTANSINLETQKERLKNYCIAKGYQISDIVSEFGSGLNDNRPKWRKLITDKTISKIIVEHKDRFTRFGFNAFKDILEHNGTEIEVVNLAEDDKQDLIQDFISIITSYCARIYGNRRSKRKTEQITNELLEIKNTN